MVCEQWAVASASWAVVRWGVDLRAKVHEGDMPREFVEVKDLDPGLCECECNRVSGWLGCWQIQNALANTERACKHRTHLHSAVASGRSEQQAGPREMQEMSSCAGAQEQLHGVVRGAMVTSCDPNTS